MIPFNDLARQHAPLRAELDRAIAAVIDGGRFVKGPQLGEFERAFAAFCGAACCVGAASGTAALHLALAGRGIGPGDEVVTTPLTFIATAEAIGHAGAQVVFADVSAATGTIDPARVAQALTPRTRAILPVHLYGQVCEMEPLMALAAAGDAVVIEDAAQAHGARYRGAPVGSLGHAACFSFFPGKNLGAFGDAGAVTTGDAAWCERMRRLGDHGRRDKYEHLVEGYNYRLDTIQAAVLSVKLKHLAAWNRERRALARRYDEGLAGLPVRLPQARDEESHVYHIYAVRADDRDALQASLRSEGIECLVHYPIPLHLQPAYAHLGHGVGAFPEAEAAARQELSLPLYPGMPPADVECVVRAVRKHYGR